MDGKELFLMAHAHTHAFTNISGDMIGAEENLCKDLAHDQMRQCPEGRHNSIAWLLWHMARCEDVMVNTVIRDVSEVLDEDWLPRLGIHTRHIGTEDSMADVELLSRQVDVQALRAYRFAVAQSTQDWFKAVEWSSLEEIPTRAEAERAVIRGALRPEAYWVFERLWGNEKRQKLWWLHWLGIGHNYHHLGEARVTLGHIKAQG